MECDCSVFQSVAEMAAIGFGLSKDAFTSLMQQVRVVSCQWKILQFVSPTDCFLSSNLMT